MTAPATIAIPFSGFTSIFVLIFTSPFSFSAMECFTEDRIKKPRKRQMSRAKRVLANRRERERVRKMNDAFEELRSAIPNYEETRVKTKLELLRIATNYIQSLKESIQNGVHDGYNSPMNPMLYPPAYDMEGSGASKSGPRISEYPYPPQFPALPPPAFTELTSFPFAPHQAVSHGTQFPPPLSGTPESSAHDFLSLLSTSLADSHSGESLLYNLQVNNTC